MCYKITHLFLIIDPSAIFFLLFNINPFTD